METNSEPIRLRGHHIELVQRYSKLFRDRPLMPSDFESRYGEDYAKHYSELCMRILEGKTPVKVINNPDDLCQKCKCRENGGCLHEEYSEPEESVSHADDRISGIYGIVIGNIYEGTDFLRMIGIR